MIRGVLVVTVIVVALAGEAAWACPACFSEDDGGQRAAYYGTTALLSGLPPLLAGLAALWLYRRSRTRSRSRNDHY